jgi:hypothetical protein
MKTQIAFKLALVPAMAITFTTAAQTFSGTNAPNTGTNFSFTVGAGATNLSLVISNSATAYSHLYLKRGGPAATNDFDFVARLNGQTNQINLELREFAVIDQGKNFSPATDQRGAPRPFDFASIINAGGGDGRDIGAVELGRPTLTIRQFASVAVLYWPYYFGDFTLQSVTDINASNSWANVAGTAVVVAGQNVLTNGPILGNRFYRLKGN